MRKLLKGNMAQKIILALIIAILCNFIIPNYSHAIDGNILVDPFKFLFTFIGDGVISLIQTSMIGEFIVAGNAKAKPDSTCEKNWAMYEGVIDWPTILISPEEIIAGKVSILNANFIKGSNGTTPGDTDGDGLIDYAYAGSYSDMNTFREEINNGKKISTYNTEVGLESLRTTISQWYNLLRNICAAALFCVLIYMGIRMVLSSVSEEKAKYKKMMVDWIVAICILFFLHYIMAIIMYSTEKIVDVIGNGLKNDGYEIEIDGNSQKFTMTKNAKGDTVSGDAQVYNLMEFVRVYVSAQDRGLAFQYLLLYFGLIAVTCVFIYKYIKRFMTMALLTLIAPIIAVTYPIDKVKDGQAQAFSMWLREYIFNALLQPIHLLVYMVLVGSAADLVKNNLIYAIVAMLSILPAEKLIKSMFGFDKASTTDGIGNFAKGAVMSQALGMLTKGGSSKSKSSSESSKIRQKDTKGVDNKKDSIGISDAYGNSEDNAGLGEGDNDNINMATMSVGDNESNDGSSGTNMKNTNQLENVDKTFTDPDKPSSTSASTNMKNTEQLENIPKTFKDPDKDNKVPKSNTVKNSTKGENKTKRKIKMPKQLKGAAKVAGKGVKYTAKKLPSIGRTIVKGAGGLVGGALGVGAAMVTGDLSHIATGVAAGVGVGSLTAGAVSGVVGVASGVVGVASGVVNAGRGIRSAYREGAIGEDAAEKLERFEAYKRDNENIKAFQKQFKNADGSEPSKKQAKAKMEEARDFIEAGYTDAKEIKKLMKMRDTGVTSDQAMAAHQQAEKYGVDHFMDEKKRSNLENSVTNQIMMDAGISNETKARQLAQQHIDLMAASKGMPSIYSNKKQPERTKVDVKDSVKRKTAPNQTAARKNAVDKHFSNNSKNKGNKK